MKIAFSKYHGTGNDFIIIDNRKLLWEPTSQQLSFLCDRHFGIGADGLMLLSETSGFDFSMRYFNSDGNESTMCGNGGRCMTAFARSARLVSTRARFVAVDGIHETEVVNTHGEILIRLKMKDTELGHVYPDGFFIDTGSPHFVMFVKDARKMDVFNSGKTFRNDRRFAPGGTNVDFVEIADNGLFVRTYERGVENETMSCGTGVTASALVAAFTGNISRSPCDILTPGGSLKVSFNQAGQKFTDIWLEGPAQFVFEGEINILQ
jgi:diaminopimelate epimerase